MTEELNRADTTLEILAPSSLSGNAILESPLLNKGTAFSEQERIDLGLLGLLPPHIESLDDQILRAYDAFSSFETQLEKHVYLRGLQDNNETLFYRLVHDYLVEMMPIIYTPVVGEACQKFSEIYRRPRGLFISYPEREYIESILDNSIGKNIRVIVVTDGERILGLGDQGAGGMGIPIGKLSLYSVCGGIDPATTLPITLDVGTNNEERIKDPLYVGWRHARIEGEQYYEFLDQFVQAVKRKWPQVILQFEDFALTHATPLLEKYRDQLCSFNDDIQGTAAVTVGTLISAVKTAGLSLGEQNVVFLGAGSAGCGIAEQIIAAMVLQDIPEAQARSQIFMVNSRGLIQDAAPAKFPFQQRLAQAFDRVVNWADEGAESISLLQVIKQAKPAILIGVSGQPGLFTEEIIREMTAGTARPIIFPLSNPTARIEATPEDLINWSAGKAIVATGSPFSPVQYNGQSYPIAQCNNSYIFPGMGLGILASRASRVTDGMLMAAAIALSESVASIENANSHTDSSEPGLLPPLDDIRKVSKGIALAVGLQAQDDGVAVKTSLGALQEKIEQTFWKPCYHPVKQQS
ncbi:MAG: NAD-dependent malic enzyme [Gammaproteobacteria bacterium]|jgi:malate dehydrogenase (oxaloacetate-decarboxylating)|nr:NAD-dependent malic enzyme [Gammaproteobacteria bacterium]MBT5222565.1 NAD-dependent malic enzyme [Gammaproteobacteria bacterium]MBT5826075.1 NAD-dependent malic enzyme [Gammaproteobacteria bacterium]MBT5967348.1 NAD-dependent malic enzyme [Gammaproteobacteria bacterium]MBT6419620.1 NAD-dependent malic enzyme [Gammaproteobacteria bacterium]